MPDHLPRWQRLRRVVSWPLLLLLAAIIVFEEYAWDELAALLARLAKWPLFARLEAGIAALGPRTALAVFLLPALMLLPVKLAALLLIEQGHAWLGLAMILLAKVGGTAVVAWLFKLTRPALMSVAWFARLHAGFVAFRERLFARLRASLPWLWLQQTLAWLRAWRGQPSAWSRLLRRLVRRWGPQKH